MNGISQNASHKSNFQAGHEKVESSAEATLRLIACLPVPKDLEERLMDGLRSAHRRGRILHWPSLLHPTGSWVRGAAAAAIVFVVAGGGWGIYTRVQPGQPAKVIVMPRAGAGSGFSSAGAMRTPQTVKGPVIPQPIAAHADDPPTPAPPLLQVSPSKNVPAKVDHRAPGKLRAGEVAAQPAVSAAK